MLISFKLGDPINPKGPGVAEVPEWLEKHISRVNSEYTPEVLGNVNVSLFKASTSPSTSAMKLHDISYYTGGQRVELSNGYPLEATDQIAGPLEKQPQKDEVFWKDSVEVSFSSIAISKPTECNKAEEKPEIPVIAAPFHPKQFCDDVYIRLMKIFYQIDNVKAVEVQNRINGWVQQLESEYVQSD
ncbi:hypothetical protein M3Y98_01144900 [Aphelenchoides besseyi]|nr:hypothetical protein M3Y98_01144900 [Aphelenchoides besseyi]KAI6210722.1 hypothetical protein M3Y96_00358100 [Aphelenchoides besseyi]